VAYVLTVGICLTVLRPKKWCGYPLNPLNPKEINDLAKLEGNEESMSQFRTHILGGFITCIGENQAVIDFMTDRIRWASWIMVVEIFFVVATKIL
jgi:hypothetical protein